MRTALDYKIVQLNTYRMKKTKKISAEQKKLEKEVAQDQTQMEQFVQKSLFNKYLAQANRSMNAKKSVKDATDTFDDSVLVVPIPVDRN